MKASRTDSLHHNIWAIAWPMILANLSIPLLGLVDAAILGHLDSAHFLAAVAVGTSLLAFLYWGFNFLRMGTTGLAAQAFGAGDTEQSRLIVYRAMLLGFVIGSILLLLSPWLIAVGVDLLAPPAESFALALSYCQIRMFSAPAVMINFAIIGWLIGRQQTRWPLLITVTTILLNIVLDVIRVLGLKLNSDGAAMATLIAEYTGCAIGLWVLRKHMRDLPGRLNLTQVLQWQGFQHLLQVNRHLFVRTLLLLGSFAFFTAQGAAQGENILAANSLLIHLLLLTSFGLDGIAHAAEALVGKTVGQRSHEQLMATCKACLQWSLLIALGYSAGFWLLQQPLVSLLTSLPEVIDNATTSYNWLILLPLVAVWSYLLDGIFIGATQTRAMLISMLLSVVAVYLPVWHLTQDWGNHGLWLAFTAFNAARGISLGGYFWLYTRQRRWC